MTLPLSTRMNADRFWTTIEASAAIGVGRAGGLSRLTLTDSDKEMRDLFARWCRDAGLSVTVDQVGSMFARRPGSNDSLSPILIGSHLDTQANGGRFDGIAGVLAGLELIRTLNDLNITTKRPIEVVNWTNEEGARFSPPMVASGCFAGVHTPEWVHQRVADDGTVLGDELRRIAYLGDAAVGGRKIDSYFELHIEQGPILDAEKVQVGVVTHGYTSHGTLVEFHGKTAHTGPTPMEQRRNALVAGARLVTAIDDIGWEYAASQGKATGSRLTAWPNKPGILSDIAHVVCDVRHDDPVKAGEMADKFRAAIDAAAKKASCEATILDTWDWGGRIFDDALVSLVRSKAQTLGFSHRDLPSQAGHDAYFMARICPTAMIFTPCTGGITHNNEELTTKDEIAPGLNVLLHTVVERANA